MLLSRVAFNVLQLRQRTLSNQGTRFHFFFLSMEQNRLEHVLHNRVDAYSIVVVIRLFC